MLGSQLGIGAYRGLVQEGLDGHMVSVTGQLDLQYVPFSDLVDPKTMLTEVRFVKPGSDFHRLARFLETRTDLLDIWDRPSKKAKVSKAPKAPKAGKAKKPSKKR
jgi:6-phosphofructokinase 1